MNKKNKLVDHRKDQAMGQVSSKTHAFKNGIVLESGQKLSEYRLAYETYGKLNQKKNNAILICPALTASQHAAGFYIKDGQKEWGWWDAFIGPGKPLDTNHFFCVCVNNLGGCYGSTGPNSIDSETQQPYASHFPFVTVSDWVCAQKSLMHVLEVDVWLAVIGGSLGGMQVIEWSVHFPNAIKHAVIIASAAQLSTQNIAFNEIARQAILTDPNFLNGHYYDQKKKPNHGLSIARMLGHVTYLSDEGMGLQFGRALKTLTYQYALEADFQIESYLHHQGKKFIEKTAFDANSYLLMTKALDYFDPAKPYDGNLAKTFLDAQCQFLIIAFSSDWRFSPKRSKEIVKALIHANKHVNYAEIQSDKGHDSFLLPIFDYYYLLKNYLDGLKNAL